MTHRRAMPPVRVVTFVVAAAFLSIASTAPAQEAAATPPLPTVSSQGFRVDPGAAALTPVESAKASAFRIVEGAPVAHASPPPSATSPRTHAASTGSASDVQQLRHAAEQGDAAAQASLGSLHFLGSGVLQDYVEAHKWLNIVAARLEGDQGKRWADLRDEVAALMTPVERAEAQRRAAEWMQAFDGGKR